MPSPTPQRSALVTGGGSGIGYAVAELLASQGWSVAIAGRSMRKLEQAALDIHAEIGADGTPIIPIAADQGDSEAIKRMIDQAVSKFGRLDALVNNAGSAKVLAIGSNPLDIIQQTYAVNAIGPAHAIELAWPIFKRQGAGCVVNVGSYAALDPFPGFFVYAGTKAAMNLMAASCAKEGAAIGVRAFCVAPGAVETELLRSAFDESVVAKEQCLRPREVGQVILECILGTRDAQNGKTIYVKREGRGVHELVV